LVSDFLGAILLTMQDNSLPYDLVVIGAGPHGLIAAHTWLEIYPESRVAILESEQEVG
jgi:dimethylaniline monooxygenase (N-oxide forming)